jgi:uncharacterized RDD family membrane protein YckC
MAYNIGYGAQPLATTQLAGFWRRFIAYIVDAIVVSIVTAIVDLALSALIHASGTDTTGTGFRGGLVSLVVGLVYFGYLWSRNGQTLGYTAFGMRLVRTDGSPVSLGLAMVRYLLIWLSFALCLVPALISAFMVGMGQQKQAIHDVLVGTLVVKV